MELGQAKKIFMITKKSENVTARTLDTYDEVMKRFIDYLFEGDILDVSVIDAFCIREFLITQQERGLRGIYSAQVLSDA